MPRRSVLAGCAAAAAVALAVGVTSADRAASANGSSGPDRIRPRVTNRCPADALPLRGADLPALRRFGLALAPHGVQRAGRRSVDYRDARARASFPTFYSGYVHSACPARIAKRVIGRTADVSVGYPHINWSASLSYSVFLIARTPHGLVGWAQMH